MSRSPIALAAYETIAEAYAAHIDTKPHNAYYERPATLSLFPDVKGKRVLDAGCGPGVYAEWLAHRGASSTARCNVRSASSNRPDRTCAQPRASIAAGLDGCNSAARFAAVGAQKATDAGLPFLGALLVASVNSVGGSVLRDLLCREVPLLFRPGEFYALAALGGAAVFLLLARLVHVPDYAAAIAGIGVAFALRVLSIKLGWRTAPLEQGPRDGGT